MRNYWTLVVEKVRVNLACFMGEKRMTSGIDILTTVSVPNYPFPERAARAFRVMADYWKTRARPTPKFILQQFEALLAEHVDLDRLYQVLNLKRGIYRSN
jgi:acyl-CoA synthetase (NDP forming)